MGGSKVEPAACPLRGLGPFRLVAMLSVYEVRKWPVLAACPYPLPKLMPHGFGAWSLGVGRGLLMSRFFEVSVRGCGIGGWLRTCCHFFVGEEVWVEVFGGSGGVSRGREGGRGPHPRKPAKSRSRSNSERLFRFAGGWEVPVGGVKCGVRLGLRLGFGFWVGAVGCVCWLFFLWGGGGGELEVPLCRVGVQDCLLSCFLFGWWGGLEVPVGCLFFFFFGWGGGGRRFWGSGCCCLAFFYWGEGGWRLSVLFGAGAGVGGSGSGCSLRRFGFRLSVCFECRSGSGSAVLCGGGGFRFTFGFVGLFRFGLGFVCPFPRGSVGGSGSGSGSAICFFSMEGGSEVPVRVRHRLLMCDVVHVTGEKGAGAGPHVPYPDANTHIVRP